LQELFGLFPPDLVFTADSGVGRGKPHPDIYLAAARALGTFLPLLGMGEMADDQVKMLEHPKELLKHNWRFGRKG
jgi:beta-phosphoglucomutase-like phosphatase (HAD superfamily)